MIGVAIKYGFEQNAELNGLVNGQIYPLVAAQQGEPPFAIYEVVTLDNVPSKDADSHIDEYLVRITAIARTYAEAQRAVALVRTTFVRRVYKLAEVNVRSCTFDGLRDLYSDDERTYGAQIDLRFRVTID